MEKNVTKDKTIMIVDFGLFIEIGIKLAKDFKKVYYHNPSWKNAFPKPNSYYIGYGVKEIEIVHNFWEVLDEIDIFCFPDVYSGDLQIHLESLGKRVWGGRNGEEGELDRVLMKEHMKDLGLPVGKYEVVKGLDNLRTYLKSNKDKFIKINALRGAMETFYAPYYKFVEPKLDELEYTLGPIKHVMEFIVEDNLKDRVEVGYDGYTIDGQYPSKCISGIELKDVAYIGIAKEYSDLPKEITDFNTKMISTFKGWEYRGFMSTELRIGKDKKSYMVDLCFSDDTEVLTNDGWKLFKNCAVENTFATLNIDTKEIEYQYATDYIVNDYEGKMIELTNDKKSIECLVTPNHLVLRTDRHKNKLFKEQADSLTDKGFIPRTGKWVSKNKLEYFELPEYHKEWDWNKTSTKGLNYTICTKVKHEKVKKIPLKSWAAFMAWYLAEGSTSQGHVVNIAQITYCNVVAKVIEDIGFSATQNEFGFRICSTQLTNYLKNYGLCDRKYIPRYILDADKEVIREFLDNYCLADGSVREGSKIYRTTSKELIDGLQECIFKVGSVGNIVKKIAKGTPVLGFKKNKKIYLRKHDLYEIIERNSFTDYWFETQSRKDRYIKKVDYNSKVYCLTVPNGTLYVRRNGKPFWSSNCARAGSPPNEIYQNMYTNLAEIIWYGAEGILVDPIIEGKFGVEALIHSSWADKNWQQIEFPEKFRDNIKIRNLAIIKDEYYAVPQAVGLPEIGAVVASGNTLDEAIEKVKEIAEQVKGYYLEIKVDSLDSCLEEFKKLEDFGVKLL